LNFERYIFKNLFTDLQNILFIYLLLVICLFAVLYKTVVVAYGCYSNWRRSWYILGWIRV